MTLPAAVFETPLLRGLDARARSLLSAASRVRQLDVGASLYAANDDADTIFVVLQGAVELSAIPRSGERARVVRRAERGDTVGEESCLGLRRRATAMAAAPTQVAEMPANLFVRGLGRSGAGAVSDRERRILVRNATADLLRTVALGEELPDTDRELVLDSVVHQSFSRSEVLYEQGDPGDDAFWVIEGLVQLQTHDDDRIQVRAYLSAGDLFGDVEAIASQPRDTTAVSMGSSRLLRIPGSVMRTLADRNPALLERIRRVTAHKREIQQEVVGEAAALTTRHVFHDLYRMQMARSLLVIDQDACVRCGHCAWSCAATHDGVSRLVRRGDKVVTRLPVFGEEPKSLLVPNSCQHCRNPSCMVDCPTGAIGRDPRGEVFIRPELCTGCGACAKACPWDNISMAPRNGGQVARPRHGHEEGASLPMLSAQVAVKCDLCRSYEGPACVQSCPTEAIVRLDPNRDVAEVAAVLGARQTPIEAKRRRSPAFLFAPSLSAVGLGAAIVSVRMHASGLWQPGRGISALAGWAALLAFVLLTAYALPKRKPRLWLRRRRRGARNTRTSDKPVRSRLRPLFRAHTVLGWFGVAAVAAHAGMRWVHAEPAVSTALGWCTALVAGLGIWGAVAYRFIPPRLARIERDGALPEDLLYRRTELLDRLYRNVSGRSEVVKRLTQRVVLPYARASWGFVVLGLSGRSHGEERRRLRATVGAVLQGRGEHKLAGLDELVATAVELRALPLRRAFTFGLRAWLVPHIVATVALWVLVLAHVAVVLGGP